MEASNEAGEESENEVFDDILEEYWKTYNYISSKTVWYIDLKPIGGCKGKLGGCRGLYAKIWEASNEAGGEAENETFEEILEDFGKYFFFFAPYHVGTQTKEEVKSDWFQVKKQIKIAIWSKRQY